MKWFFTGIVFLACNWVHSQLPSDFFDQIIHDDWNRPMGMTFDEQSNLYVWEKSGKVFIIDTLDQKLENPLIDISEEVGDWRDHGLLGFALDPSFRDNGFFYLLYAVDRHHLFEFGTPSYNPDSTYSFQASIGRVTRYTADPTTQFTTTLLESRKILLGTDHTNGIPLMHESHGVGSLVFGTDGSLLVSTGDGNTNKGVDLGGDSLGSYATDALLAGIIESDENIGNFRAQYLGSLNGKILRIDPNTGAGLDSNPYFDSEDPYSASSRIWAKGLRNPFRITLQPESGSHYPEEGNPGIIMVGDVGASQWEELNMVSEAGQNFGWPLKEGYIPFWGFWNTPSPENKLAPNPLFSPGVCDKEYFNFKDLFSEELKSGSFRFVNPCDTSQLIPTNFFPNMETSPVVSWGHNQFNLPAKAYVGFFNEQGKIQGVDISGPLSNVDSDIFVGASSIAGTFYGSAAFPEKYHGAYFHADFTGWIQAFFFDDKNELTRVEPFHQDSKQVLQILVDPKDGSLLYLSLKDGGSIHKIEYGGNPPPIAIAESDKTFGPSPLQVQFNGSESYDPSGLPISYYWNFGNDQTSTLSNPIFTFEANGESPEKRTVSLTVTDSLGLTDSTELIISLNNTPPLVKILNPVNNSNYSIRGNTRYLLDAEVDDEEFEIEDLQFKWQTFLHHNSHAHPEDPNFQKDPAIVISPLGCEEDAVYWYSIELEVTDPAGLSNKDVVEIFPYCGPDFFKLSELIAEGDNREVQLRWKTNEEIDVIGFAIERSPEFEQIGWVDARIDRDYSFIDKKPNIGENFYRIKAIRTDQVFDYSNTVKIKFPQLEQIAVYPNPTSSIINIEIKQTNSDNVKFELFDSAGKQIFLNSWITSPRQTFSSIVELTDINNGLYFYQISQGDQMTSGHLIIAK